MMEFVPWLVPDPDNDGWLVGPPVAAVVCDRCGWWHPCEIGAATRRLQRHAYEGHGLSSGTFTGRWMAADSFHQNTDPAYLDLGIVREP